MQRDLPLHMQARVTYEEKPWYKFLDTFYNNLSFQSNGWLDNKFCKAKATNARLKT